jgi:hypothetical protein
MPRSAPDHLLRGERERDAKRQTRHRDETIVSRDDFARVLNTEEGRRTMSRILKECLVTTPVFSQNAMVMSANAGKQELGLWLCTQLRDAHLDNYLKMQAENDA